MPIAPGVGPSGMALDNKTHRLLSICGNKMMAFSDAEAGKVVYTLPISDGCDSVVKSLKPYLHKEEAVPLPSTRPRIICIYQQLSLSLPLKEVDVHQ